MPKQQRLAGSNFSYFCFPLNDFLEVQKRLDFETIELFGGSPQLWIDAYEHEDGKKIQKKIKEAGTGLSGADTGNSSISISALDRG